MVERMLDLLADPRPRSRSSRLRKLLLGLDDRDLEWRHNAGLVCSDLLRRLDDPDERFSDEAAHLTRWMDWDSRLERQPAEVRQLTTKIQHALELLERSRGRRMT